MACQNPSPPRGPRSRRSFVRGEISGPALPSTGRLEVNLPREARPPSRSAPSAFPPVRQHLCAVVFLHTAPSPPRLAWGAGSPLPSPRLPVNQAKRRQRFRRYRERLAGADGAPGGASRGRLRARMGHSALELLVSPAVCLDGGPREATRGLPRRLRSASPGGSRARPVPSALPAHQTRRSPR